MKRVNLSKHMDILIWIITIIEMLLAILIIKLYSNVYAIEGFILIIIMQPFIYMWIITKEGKNKKILKTVGAIVMILIPLIIIFTLPRYTYNGGKEIVEVYLGEVEFIKLEKKDKSISIEKDNEYIFLKDKVYKYKVTKDKKEYEILIDASNGEQVYKKK